MLKLLIPNNKVLTFKFNHSAVFYIHPCLHYKLIAFDSNWWVIWPLCSIVIVEEKKAAKLPSKAINL